MLRLLLILACLPLFALLYPAMVIRSVALESTYRVTDLNELLQPGKHRVLIRIDDRERRFVFYTPKGFKPGEALPLVFFFHGAGGTAEQAFRTYGWPEKADAENFFVAFPEGLPVRPDGVASFLLNPHIWRDERAGLPASGVNDVHFFEELLNRLEAALPVYYLTGTADPLIPYRGGTVTLPWGKARTLPPVQESADTWAKLDGCPPEPQTVSDENGVRVQHYGPGKDGAEVFFTTVEGNGHHWPGTVEPLPHIICGPTLDPFHATDRIWDFFVRHPLP